MKNTSNISPFSCVTDLQVIDNELQKEMNPSHTKDLIQKLNKIKNTYPGLFVEEFENYSYKIYRKATTFLVDQSKSYAQKVETLSKELRSTLNDAEHYLSEIEETERLDGKDLKTLNYIKNYFNQVEDFVAKKRVKAPDLDLDLTLPHHGEEELVLIEDIYGIGEDLYFGKEKKALLSWVLLPEFRKKEADRFSHKLKGLNFESLPAFEKIQVMMALAQAVALGETDPTFLTREEIEEIFKDASISLMR